MATYFPGEKDLQEKRWFVVDADSAVLGRLSARVAAILRGKHKSIFTPHADTGDFVVVINAEKVRLTGNKLAAKTYERYSGYPGGLRVLNARNMLTAKPEELIKIAVRGMLPKNALGRKMIKKLKVYKGSQHPHQAQKPEALDVKEARRA